jgi:hypothetical protein
MRLIRRAVTCKDEVDRVDHCVHCHDDCLARHDFVLEAKATRVVHLDHVAIILHNAAASSHKHHSTRSIVWIHSRIQVHNCTHRCRALLPRMSRECHQVRVLDPASHEPVPDRVRARAPRIRCRRGHDDPDIHHPIDPSRMDQTHHDARNTRPCDARARV